MKQLLSFKTFCVGMALVMALGLTLCPYTLAGRINSAQAEELPLSTVKAEDYLTVAGHTFRVLSVVGGTGVVISAHMPTVTVDIDENAAGNTAAVNEKVIEFSEYFKGAQSFIDHFSVLNGASGASGNRGAVTFGGAEMTIPESLADKKILFRDSNTANLAQYGYAQGGGMYAAKGSNTVYLLMGGMITMNAAGFGITEGTGSKTSPYIIASSTPTAASAVAGTSKLAVPVFTQPVIDYSDYESIHLWINTPKGAASLLSGKDYENYYNSGVFNPDERGVFLQFQTDIPLEGTQLTLPEYVKFNQVSIIGAEDVVDHKGRPVNLSRNIAVNDNSVWQRNLLVTGNTLKFEGLSVDTKRRASIELLAVLSVQAGFEGDIYLTAENQAKEYYAQRKIATVKKAADVYTKERWKEMTPKQQAAVEEVLGRKVTWKSTRDFFIVENEPGALSKGRQVVVALDEGLFFTDGFKMETLGGLKLGKAELIEGYIVAEVTGESSESPGAAIFTDVATDKELTAAIGWHGIYLVGDAMVENVGEGPGKFETGAIETIYIPVYPKG